MGNYPLWKPATKDLPRHHLLGDGGQIDAAVREALDGKLQIRVADTGISSPLIAQELSPEVIPVFVRNFPLYDMVAKVPSNGLSHTFQQQTGFTTASDPATISETGTVSDYTNQYLRRTSNIAVFAHRRGVTLKAQFAGQNAGGVAADMMGRELSGGLIQMARDAQNEMLRYQESTSTATTTTDPNGKFDANGFNGLRYQLLNNAPPENSQIVNVTSSGWTDQRVLKAVRQVVNAIWDKGGRPDLIVTNTTGQEDLFEDQFQLVRYVKSDQLEIIPGLTVSAISTPEGLLPVLPVPGNSIGTWTSSGHTYTDIFILSTETLEMPYLGSPSPTVLRIPIGTDGTLRELAIPFAMFGLACLAPQYLGRVSLQIS
jgi:hypothetical protein